MEILRRAQRLRVIFIFRRTADVGFIFSSFFMCFLLGVIVLFAPAVALQLYVGCYTNIAGRKPVSRSYSYPLKKYINQICYFQIKTSNGQLPF